MRWTQILIPTTRENPADVTTASHQLLLRAGMIRQVTSDGYALLPLAKRSLTRLTQLVRRELAAMGAMEIALPERRPVESGAMASEIVASAIRSYRQLPLAMYRLYAATPDPAASGLLRALDPLEAELFIHCPDQASMDAAYNSAMEACRRIAQATGGEAKLVENGRQAHVIHVPCESGPHCILASDRGNYVATVGACPSALRSYDLGGQPHGDLEKVHTPGAHSIDDLTRALSVPADQTLKTIVFQAGTTRKVAYAPKWIIAVVRGDHEVNQTKLAEAARAFNVDWIELADNEEMRSRFTIGFVGPDAAMKEFFAALIIDPDAAQDRAWVAGANEVDYHVRNFNWFRDAGDRLADPAKTLVADIRNARPGDLSPLGDGGRLVETRGYDLADLRQFQTRYTSPAGAGYVDAEGKRHPILSMTARMDLTLMLIAAIEHNHDEHGIIWPAGLAPFPVCLTPIRYDGQSREVADRLHDELNAAGIDAILDDRDARAGAKFTDADLIGFPIRINIGERGLKEGKLELKHRATGEVRLIDIADAASAVRAMLQANGAF